MLGDFLELSLSTGDMLASLDFYRKLGFQEAPVGGGWHHPYAVVTDGRLYLGLHKREPQSPALSFVLPELRHKLADFEALGIEFAHVNIEPHRFNHMGFEDPDGGQLILVEARTYSPVHASHLEPSLCGYFVEYRLPVLDVPASARFWESLGLIVETGADQDYAQASWGGINLGLARARPRARPALVFESPDLEQATALLGMRGLPLRRDADGLHVATPEGIELLLREDAT